MLGKVSKFGAVKILVGANRTPCCDPVLGPFSSRPGCSISTAENELIHEQQNAKMFLETLVGSSKLLPITVYEGI